MVFKSLLSGPGPGLQACCRSETCLESGVRGDLRKTHALCAGTVFSSGTSTFCFPVFFNTIINPNPNFCLHDKVTQARVCGHYGENTQGEILLKDGERKYFL